MRWRRRMLARQRRSKWYVYRVISRYFGLSQSLADEGWQLRERIRREIMAECSEHQERHRVALTGAINRELLPAGVSFAIERNR